MNCWPISKLVLDLTAGRAPDCASLLLTSDGQTVACGAVVLSGRPSAASCAAAAGLAKPGIDEYSVATGKLTSVLYRYAGPCVMGGVDVLWASPTGSTVLGYLSVAQELERPSAPPRAGDGRVRRPEVPAAADPAGRRPPVGRHDRILTLLHF